MDEVFQKADISEGINVDGEDLTNLRFADIVTLFSGKKKTKEFFFKNPHKQSELSESESWPRNTQGKKQNT